MATDRDVSLLSRTCKDMHRRLLAPESTIWRVRFKERYDLPQGRKSRELKPEYQTRAIVLPRQLDFRQSENEQQKLWLEVLQTMVRESTTLPVEIESSKTYHRIREVLTLVEFLSNPKRNQPSDMFCAVQLVCTLSQNMKKQFTKYIVILVSHTHVSRYHSDPSLWSIRLRHRNSIFFPRECRWSIHQA